MGAGVITVTIALDEGTDGATVKSDFFSDTADARTTALRLAELLRSAASQAFPANVNAWVDNSVGTNAYVDVTFAGPYVTTTAFKAGGGSLFYVAGTPDYSLGQWSDSGGDVTASFTAAVNNGTARGLLYATRTGAATVRVYWRTPGASGNGQPAAVTDLTISLSSSTFSGGNTAGAQYKEIGSVTNNALFADGDETIVLGRTLTWRTAGTPANGEITIGASATLSAANLATTVNAYAPYQGICTATAASGQFVLTVYGGSRFAGLLPNVDMSGGITFTSTYPTNGCTDSYVSGTRVALSLGKGAT